MSRLGHPNEQGYVYQDSVSLNPSAPQTVGDLVQTGIFLWQPATLSWIKANADASGNLNTAGGASASLGSVNVLGGSITVIQGTSPWVTSGGAVGGGGSVVVLGGTINVIPQSGANTLGSVSVFGRTQPIAGLSGGAVAHSVVCAATENATLIKGAAGTLYSVQGFNINASPRYLKMYDSSALPLSSSSPVRRYVIPGNASGAGFVLPFPVGENFGSGIGFRLVTGITDGDITAPSANEVVLTFGYK